MLRLAQLPSQSRVTYRPPSAQSGSGEDLALAWLEKSLSSGGTGGRFYADCVRIPSFSVSSAARCGLPVGTRCFVVDVVRD